ncbi:PH domain-containing protein [Ciceribacter sp. L1K23]|uniref:photosynthetic complex putative assembly protein PuhB n=1 Tax=Ciceribacter sp. L1K23 TaxID=2820276 RepID=UPI001B823824|nr:PH domain-containing protein [Ciceribacter sp. L1K23]
MKQFVTREHEIEPVPGLPGELPEGEQILWQGRPSAGLVARHGLKSRWIGAYFLILAVWAAASGLSDGQPIGGIVFSVAVLTMLAAIVLGMIEFFAWAVERTTLYTITNERVVMRFGVALSMSLNLPFNQINAVSLGKLGGKAGTIAIGLRPGQRLSWLVQWPHVRGWRFAAPEPSLICLPDADTVCDILAVAYARYASVHSGHPRLVVTNEPIEATGHVAAAE